MWLTPTKMSSLNEMRPGVANRRSFGIVGSACLLQVSSQARNEGRKESRKLLATLRSNADASVRLAVAVALQDCLYFDALCQPGLPDLCRVLASGDRPALFCIG